MTAQFRALIESSFLSQVRAIRRVASLRPMVELIGAFALAIVVYLCGRLVAQGTLTVASLGAFIMALDVMNQGAKNLGSLSNTYGQVQAAADRIYSEILDMPEAAEESADAAVPLDLGGRIEFRDVSFAYPDGTRALSHVSFSVEPGTSIALVGPSGAGKSTIADLLLRFYEPTEGQVLVDGVDVRQFSARSLRMQIGVVPQQTFLFAGTIADNLRLGMEDASEEQLTQALCAAHAQEFVARMPEGINTSIGERNTRLSGGEAQRVAIARALVRRPKILVFDEATSNLDAHSEQVVQEALDEIMIGRTTIMIAHRLTTAARADRILMLRHGEVIEQGSHAELLQAGGAYAAMYRAFGSGLLGDDVG